MMNRHLLPPLSSLLSTSSEIIFKKMLLHQVVDLPCIAEKEESAE
jgi:hypothetical protein